MDENIRFIEVLDALKAAGHIVDYVNAANILGTNKAGISDIKSGRKKLSVELLRRLKSSYPETSLEWIIMGKGTMFSRSSDVEVTTPSAASGNDMVDKLLAIIQEKDKTIREQAEEIGQLRERIGHISPQKGNAE